MPLANVQPLECATLVEKIVLVYRATFVKDAQDALGVVLNHHDALPTVCDVIYHGQGCIKPGLEISKPEVTRGFL